jgi:hypothetical protein
LAPKGKGPARTCSGRRKNVEEECGPSAAELSHLSAVAKASPHAGVSSTDEVNGHVTVDSGWGSDHEETAAEQPLETLDTSRHA